MKSLKGHFLIASPYLADPNFVKAVVLLVHHDKEGAFGVVLNRPADSTVQDLWEKVGQSPCESEQLVLVGGPVPGPLMAVHSDLSLAETEIIPGVYFAAQRDNLEKLLQQQEHPYRIFVGHSGWGAGQLENELKQGAWLTAPAKPEHVFYDDTDLWKKVRDQVGDSMLVEFLGIEKPPKDPNLN
jgi:putative transcriptional regulator